MADPLLPRLRRLVGELALVALLSSAVSCSGATASRTPGPTDAPRASVPSITTGAPPTPIVTGPERTVAPAHTGLVVRLTSCDDVCVIAPGTVVLADGRVIFEHPDGYRVRALTAAGLAWVRTRVDASPFLRVDADYRPTTVPGSEPDAYPSISYGFALEREGRRVSVSSVDPGMFARDPTRWIVSDAMRALADLAASLSRPELWVPRDLWAGEAVPYEPEDFLVVLDVVPAQPRPDLRVDVDAIDQPFARFLEAAGAPYRRGAEIAEGSRCLVAARAEVERMARSETALGSPRSLESPQTTIEYGWRRGNGSIQITTQWLLPYQTRDCTDAFAW